MEALIPTFYGLEIIESKLAIKGVGYKYAKETKVYLSEEDCQNIKKANGNKELGEAIKDIKIFAVDKEPRFMKYSFEDLRVSKEGN